MSLRQLACSLVPGALIRPPSRSEFHTRAASSELENSLVKWMPCANPSEEVARRARVRITRSVPGGVAQPVGTDPAGSRRRPSEEDGDTQCGL